MTNRQWHRIEFGLPEGWTGLKKTEVDNIVTINLNNLINDGWIIHSINEAYNSYTVIVYCYKD